MTLAKKLMLTCHQMYKEMATGLSPEIAHFDMTAGAQEDIYVKVSAGKEIGVKEGGWEGWREGGKGRKGRRIENREK